MAPLEAMASCALGATKWSRIGSRIERDLRIAGGERWVRATELQVHCIRGSSVGRSTDLVVVTRERGKNGKLMKALGARGVQCLELPLIEHKTGPDLHKLSNTIRDVEFEWIVVTSPEAATVFIEGWRDVGSPRVCVAVVGAGTGQEFDKVTHGREALQLEFSPSKATAKVLAVELPKIRNGNGRVLYPSSSKAGSDLETGLSDRGFEVTRLNTYATESVKAVDREKAAAAMVAPVVPSPPPPAVTAWMDLMGPWNGAAVCIGTTSAQAARKAGLNNVFYPESPGMEGWVESIMEALGSQVRDTSAV